MKPIEKISNTVACDRFYTYDNYMDDQERRCVNCCQKESEH